jgi:Pyridine nucleotide-disulphide oxidoreductase
VLSQAESRRDLKGMTEHNKTHKVVVIGGGFAGTLAANHLRMRGEVDITLVNPRPKFVQRLRLHQLVAGSGDATVDYGILLGDGVRLLVDSATRIDTADTVLSRIAGARPAPFALAFVATTVGLGRRAAVGQFTRKDDTPVDFHIHGRVPALIKEAVIRGIPWGLRREARKPGVTVWYKGGEHPSQTAADPQVATSP